MIRRALRIPLMICQAGRFVPMLFLVGALVASGAVAQDEANREKPKTWQATAFIRGEGIGIRVIDYWSRGPNMVARTLIQGRPVTTIVFGSRYIVYDAVAGKGINIGRSSRALESDNKRERPFAFEFEEMKAAGGEKIEDLHMAGRRGEIWQITNGKGRQKLWVSVGVPQIPIRLETFDRKTGSNVELDYQNWIFDLDLPDRFFAAPSGIEFETLEYDAYMEKSLEGPVGRVPVLYPDLLHGERPS